MKILHVLWGFSPWRGGGLVAYAEDTMKVQVESGHSVASFFAGRRDLMRATPRLTEWSLNNIVRYEIRNSPIVNCGSKGTFPAYAELGEQCSEQFFLQALDEFGPDLVHFHELACLPFSIVDICSRANIPTLLTLHDYYFICPSLFLFNKQNAVCADPSGNSCHACVSAYSDDGFSDRIRTLRMEKRSKITWLVPIMQYLIYWMKPKPKLTKQELIEIHLRRFQENCSRIHKIDIVLAQSNRVKDIFSHYTGRRNIEVLHSAPSNIKAIVPKKIIIRERIIHFATINGAMGPYKGVKLLLEAMKILHERRLDNRYILHVYGGVSPRYLFDLFTSTTVRFHGSFSAHELNDVLEGIDVGLVPSLCEEAYGYAGIEFLAKGIPVIGNKIGGIQDYTIDGCSGWLNASCSPRELADIMNDIIQNPEEIVIRNTWLMQNKSSVIPDSDVHNAKLIECYEEAINKHHV